MAGQYLDYHRETLRWKCAGLNEAQLKRRPVPPSTLSLLGLVRQLTEVELHWFSRWLDDQPVADPYSSPENRDGDFDDLDSATLAEVWEAYDASVADSQRVLAGYADGGELCRGEPGRPRNLRWVLVHVVEEYARHNGHADLLREAIDGQTGE